MKQRTAVIIGAGLITFFSIVIIFLFYLPHPALRYGLAKAGFADASFEKAYIDASGLHISGLKLDDSDNKIALIEADISLSGLLNRRLKTLTLKDAVIDLTAPAFTKTEENTANGFTLPILPVQKIDLQNVTVRTATPAGKMEILVNGKGSAQDMMSITVEGRLIDGSTGAFSGKADISFRESKAVITLDKILFSTAQFSVAEGNADLNVFLTDPIAIEGKAMLRQVSYTLPGKPALTTPLNIDLTLNSLSSEQGATGISGTVYSSSGLLNIKINGKHNMQSGAGNLKLDMPPTDFMPGVYQLADVIPISADYADDVTGSLGGNVQVKWQSAEKLNYETKGMLFLKDVNAVVNDLAISGISAVLKFDSLAPPVMHNQKISIRGLDSGLPLTNGIMVLSVDKNSKITLHQGSWELAKGKITSSSFTVTPDNLSANATLTATGLDLAELFKIAPMDGLSALGTANGVLPLKMKDGKLSIVDGVLETVGKGNISYDPKDPPDFLKDDKNAGIVNLRNALRNFNYQGVKITVNGELGGQQSIKLNVSGSNPDFYDGHAVNLNLNVEGPLENVLRYKPGSNQIPDSIRDQIESYENEHAKK